ncbi:Polyketide cyclase / dehydrase and lipid transport [Calidithermus terrae]|uniref:Polyketide cyclase / dehydrase and lipid transport n=1 Tax=Calidithermus terrae TaxID=1408545 RepID=A0A399EX76_9DEIN|nr:SRPBCC family protein [Calidithermus terrae]RIH88056.1 Polyketide cyclase / dehydrase and lipid transport [Calidithermus terrae]
MGLRGEATVVVHAPLPEVWEEFVSFERWPEWSSSIRAALREGTGWRFVYRGAQDVDLSFVLRATRWEPRRLVAFETVKELEHNADVKGWASLERVEGGTRLTLFVEAQADAGSGLAQKLAGWWAQVFVEHSKNLKVVLQDFQAHLEGDRPTPPLAPDDAALSSGG